MLFGDGIVLLLAAGLAAFFIIPDSRQLFESATASAPLLLAFFKFALLATGGEVIALRLRSRSYSIKEFGLVPKMVIWGMLGIVISWTFTIFSTGVPRVFPSLALLPSPYGNILTALCISVFMNLIFAPGMMLFHHLTDRFISENKGTFPISRMNVLHLLKNADWERMWGFVYKKTIPLFWIPAHTITFLLPGQYRVLFAALLSVALGLILGSVQLKDKKNAKM